METLLVETFFSERYLWHTVVSGDDFMLTSSVYISWIWKVLFGLKNHYAYLGYCYFTLLLRPQTLFFPQVYWICWPPTPQQFSITLAPIPPPHPPTPTWNTNAAARASLISRVFVKKPPYLSVALFHPASQGILWVLCSCQAAEGSCHKTLVSLLTAHWPLAWISCLHHPY